uniref:Gnk2-homologous domain-containing protein n=1 Tax=Quercus lobata TaxID=97700 RepID=A0A7N2LS55_QUELO
MGAICSDQPNETANANYQSSLTVLLNSLSSKASQNYSFYNGSFNTGIYGLFLCRAATVTATVTASAAATTTIATPIYSSTTTSRTTATA